MGFTPTPDLTQDSFVGSAKSLHAIAARAGALIPGAIHIGVKVPKIVPRRFGGIDFHFFSTFSMSVVLWLFGSPTIFTLPP